MAQLIRVTDATDARLRDYVGLRDTQLRHSLEAAEGLFIAEGEKVIHRALAAGYVPRSLLLAERWWDGLAQAMAAHACPVYLVSEALAEEVTGFHVHRGALGSFHRRSRWSVADLWGYQRLVVAEDIVDHTNVGAILRSAAGLGWDGALLAPRCADPLYRRSIKVSMGAAFTLPWARLDDHATAIGLLRKAGFTVAALALSERAVDLREFAAQPPPAKLALLLGTEGHGLSERWRREADVEVMIGMHAGVDSLNVAAAAAVACWALG